MDITTDGQKKASFLLVETEYENNDLIERVEEGLRSNFRRSLSLGYGTYRDMNEEGRDDDIDFVQRG